MTVLGLKPFLGALAVALGVIAYAIYIRDTVKKDIKPHPFSWLVWGFVSTVASVAQQTRGAGPGVWVTWFTAAICFLIGLLTLRNKWEFSRSDWAAFGLGIGGVICYAGAKSPTAAAIFATLADLVAYQPTISKGWSDPRSENAPSFLLNSIKFLPALFALNTRSIATALYPSALVLMNMGVCAMLVERRRELRKRDSSRALKMSTRSNL
jgi:hypothetical protein